MSHPLLQSETESKRIKRIWCDGCYDMVHFGHANSLRQAKMLGDYLIVGIHSDDEITKHKRTPVFSERERAKMVASIRWVDEVVTDQPYVTTIATLDKYACDICCHGDDITVSADGVDTYQQIKSAGRYQNVTRTAGISTTNLMERILLCANDEINLIKDDDKTASKNNNIDRSPWTGSVFLPTTEKIVQFTACNLAPQDNQTIIYAPGAFDLFHLGHVEFLEKIYNNHGTYIIIGLYDESVVKKLKGANYPIMTLQERVLNVSACKYVSNVVIGAPYIITQNMIDHFKIDFVAHGTVVTPMEMGTDPFALPKQLGKLVMVDSMNDTTTETIVQKIARNRAEFEEINRRKQQREVELFRELMDQQPKF